MKILLITARYYPEPFTITNIVEKLKEYGHDITVLTGVPNYGKWKIYDGYKNVQTETINGIKVIRVNEKPRKKGFLGLLNNYMSIHKEYKKFLKNHHGDYDLIFSHVMSPIFTISGLKKYLKRHNIPHFMYGFDLWPESLIAAGYFKRYFLSFQILKRYSKKLYETCDLIAYASPSCLDYFNNYLKIDVPVIHIYQPTLTKLIENSYVGHIYRKDSNKTRILFCGTIAKFNHLDLFIKAIKKDDIRDKIIFDIVGSGSDEKRIRKLVKKYKLEDCVNFYGRVSPEETRKYYNQADVLFVPLYYNSATSLMIPQKVIEYFMYGRPILGMIKGDGADLIKEASSINIISDQNVDSLSEAITNACDLSSEELLRAGKENYNFYISNPRFTLDVVCQEINNEITNLVNKKVNNY
ncbi:MAG: glycosyltransferase family 4 protein [Bacilli bacterium]|jgi:glycosyltransferase involved in cell wall biosynthesis